MGTYHKCRLCDGEAIAIFYFNKGCYCCPDEIQALCLHHSIKSKPVLNGSMTLIEDLSFNKDFEGFWKTKFMVK